MIHFHKKATMQLRTQNQGQTCENKLLVPSNNALSRVREARRDQKETLNTNGGKDSSIMPEQLSN